MTLLCGLTRWVIGYPAYPTITHFYDPIIIIVLLFLAFTSRLIL